MDGYPWSHALLLLALLPLAAAEPWVVCNSSSGSYSSGSTYGANLVSLVSTLSGKSTSSKSLFVSDVLGAAPDTVYGLILCRGDISFNDCYDCGIRARQDAARACTGRSRDVALCYNQCYVRLADTDFLASTDNSGEVPLISGNNISSNDVAGYNRAVTGLLNATAQYAVDNTTTLFATGQWEGPDPGFSRIYSVAQCAADISPAQCRSCLQDLLARWFTWFNMPPNGDAARVAGSRCSLRSQIGQDPFYTGAAMLQLPAKTPAPGPAATAARPTTTPDNKKRNSKRVMLIAVIVSVVLIFLLVGMCMLWKIYWKENSGGNLDYAMFEEETPLHIDIRRFTYAELKLITKNFKSTIGKGGFGIVYHGILENGDEVAVKVLMETSIAESTDFLPEVQTLSKVHHKNLVTLQGYCQNKKCLALVYDFMPRGNLQQLLRGAEDYTLNWEQRLHIAFDSAQGLEYLHELCTPSIVHRDVKSANILLDKNLELLDVYNASSLQSVIDLAMDCVENAAIDRPAMTEVVARLKVWLPVVSSEKHSVNGTTQYKYSMDSEIRKQYQLSISGASTEGSSFQSGSIGRMSEISMSSGRYAESKCIVTVYTAQEAPFAKSSVTISEFYDNAQENVDILPAQNTSSNLAVDLDPMGSDTDMADTPNEQHLTSTTPTVM
ncbi:hypothetical protein QYE76_016954 [Lolium multiflorum]|uniref:Uncharacterized protein n=1 Tax=Lolium multiflorum TaxID=4521 RepID=A0AAD8UX08_LOLMU|nr:hypothetical protein QYE76_016954 [Lolium multiflorum]